MIFGFVGVSFLLQDIKHNAMDKNKPVNSNFNIILVQLFSCDSKLMIYNYFREVYYSKHEKK